MLGLGNKHHLPKFPPEAIPTFKRLCRTLSAADLKELKAGLDAALTELRQSARHNPRINLPLAEAIAQRCYSLLELYDHRTPQEQSLIVGAVAYFAISEDPLPDDQFASGFNDDAAIVNYVLEKLGIDGKFLNIDE